MKWGSVVETGEMAQWASEYKPKDLSLNTQHPYQKPGVVVQACL